MIRYRNRSSVSILLLSTLLLAILTLTLVMAAVLHSLALPDVRGLLERPVDPSHTSKILAADGTVLMSYGKFAHRPVPLSQMSPHVVNAVLATEDRRFYQHHGIDPLGVGRALLHDFGKHGIREGGSTISQQLARTLFLSNERSWSRKLKEAMLAIRLEDAFNKHQLLALYLNNAYFGEGAYGVEAASRVYFNKSAAALKPQEGALLAGLIQAPSQYDPFQHPALAKARRNEVLGNLVETGRLDRVTVAHLQRSGVGVVSAGRELSRADRAPYFTRLVLPEVLERLHLDEAEFWQGGYRVVTTLDARGQRLAEQTVRRLTGAGAEGPRQGALLSLDSRNRVLAYVGGRDFDGNQFDHVSLAHRPAGSLFKMFVYAGAFRQGLRPDSVYDDTPVRFGAWMPRNYDRRSHGPMTLADALVHSNNVVAVKVLNDVHPEPVIRLAREMGVNSAMAPNLSLALGAADVTLSEMTGAFSVMRANGLYRQPVMIDRIEDAGGRTVYRSKSVERPVLKRPERDSMVAMLREVVRRGTGRAALLPVDTAGKTGTSDEYRDAWFVGFTPDVTTGVWVGNDDNQPMDKVTGGSLPALIWRNYMAAYLPKSYLSGGRHFDLAYAMPLQSPDSRLALINQDHAAGPADIEDAWAARAEQLAVSLENKASHIRFMPPRPAQHATSGRLPRFVLAAVEAQEGDNLDEDAVKPPHGAALHKASGKHGLKKWKGAWRKFRHGFRKMLDEDE